MIYLTHTKNGLRNSFYLLYHLNLYFTSWEQSCLEFSRHVPSALCLVLVDLFLSFNLCTLRWWCCSVEKTSKKKKKKKKKLRVEDFDRFGSVGILFSLPKIRSISAENPKEGRLLVWGNISIPPMSCTGNSYAHLALREHIKLALGLAFFNVDLFR